MENKKNISIYLGLIASGAVSTQAAYADIHYTDLDPDLPLYVNDTFEIDINNDGIVDFKVRWNKYYLSSPYFSAPGSSIVLYGVNPLNGINVETDPYNSNYLYDCFTNVGNEFSSADSFDNQVYLLSKTPFIMEYGGIWGGFYCSPTKNNYLGLRFQISGNTHYGWIRVRPDIIDDYAYNDCPNEPILAGATATGSIACGSCFPAYSTQNYSFCDQTMYNGIMVVNDTIIHDTLFGMSGTGCDSIMKAFFTSSYSSFFSDTIYGCDSVLYNAETYFSSQQVKDTLFGGNTKGCDSINVVQLIVGNNTSSDDSLVVCNAAFVHGNLYESSQIIVDTLITSTGCDSIVYTNLTIHNDVNDTNLITTCDSMVLDGVTYFNSQTVIKQYPNAANNGCDSILYTLLTVHYSTEINLDTTISENDSLLWNNQFYYETGQYDDTLLTSYNCDSIITLQLTVLEDPIVNGIIVNPTASFFIYPNPANEVCYIETGENTRGNIRIYNTQGQLVYQSPTQGERLVIHTSALGTGMYYITLTDGDEIPDRQKMIILE